MLDKLLVRHGKHNGIKALTIYAGVEPKICLYMRDVSNGIDDRCGRCRPQAL